MDSKAIQDFKRIAKEFFITTFLLGSALVLAVVSNSLLQTGDYQLVVGTTILSLVLAGIGGLYSVPKLSRRVNLELFSWRFSYSATPEMAFFFVLTIIVGFSAINTGNNLLYLVFSVLIAVIIASGIISEGSLRKLDVSLRFPEHIFANQETLLELSLINRKKLLPSFSLTVGVNTGEEEKKNLLVKVQELFLGPQQEKGFGKLAHYSILPSNSKVSQRIPYTFKKRGNYQITGFMISTKFPFGFLRKVQEKEAAGEVVVYPEPQPISSFAASIPVLTGWLESSQKGNSTDLYRMRQYVPNDSMRYIDWKATAKTRRLMVKEFTTEDERRFSLVLDDQQIDDLADFQEKFERAVVLIASLADYLNKQGSEVRLLTPKEQTDFGLGTEHLYKILKVLALIQPRNQNIVDNKPTKSISEFLEMDKNDFKIIVTPLPSLMPTNNIRIKVISLSKL